MSTKLLVPLLNDSVTTFKGPTWFLSEDISIESIAPEDFGIIFSAAPDQYKAILLAKTKCIRIENVDPISGSDIARCESSKIAFLLNYFKTMHPIVLLFAVQITKKHKARIDKIIDLPAISDTHMQRKKKYHIRSDTRRDYISQFYKVLNVVHSKHPGILLTLDRFNSALLRTEPCDKIIDITISLESLISGTSELRNRFSLYNSWTAEPDTTKRKKTFELLMSLYDARSSIVHGTDMSTKTYGKTIQPLLDRWNDIISITERVLGYYIFFVYSKGLESWDQHLENLALGLDKRIV